MSKILTIIFNDNSSKYNRDLVDFLKRNIESAIIKGRITFNFKIAEMSELENLREKGITRLPAMTVDNEIYIGVPEIIDEIRKRIKTSKQKAVPKTDDEILTDYNFRALGDIKKDPTGKFIIKEDEDQDETLNLQAKMNSEVDRRKNMNNKNNSIPQTKIIDRNQEVEEFKSRPSVENKSLDKTQKKLEESSDIDDNMVAALLSKLQDD